MLCKKKIAFTSPVSAPLHPRALHTCRRILPALYAKIRRNNPLAHTPPWFACPVRQGSPQQSPRTYSAVFCLPCAPRFAATIPSHQPLLPLVRLSFCSQPRSYAQAAHLAALRQSSSSRSYAQVAHFFFSSSFFLRTSRLRSVASLSSMVLTTVSIAVPSE